MRKIALHFLADHPACSAAQLYAALREHYAEEELRPCERYSASWEKFVREDGSFSE